jgi:hypothetical protein
MRYFAKMAAQDAEVAAELERQRKRDAELGMASFRAYIQERGMHMGLVSWTKSPASPPEPKQRPIGFLHRY